MTDKMKLAREILRAHELRNYQHDNDFHEMNVRGNAQDTVIELSKQLAQMVLDDDRLEREESYKEDKYRTLMSDEVKE